MVANNTKLNNSNAELTVTNKQLTGEVKDMLLFLKKKGGGPNGYHSYNDRFKKYGYCNSYGYKVFKGHKSNTYNRPGDNHKEGPTHTNTTGGSNTKSVGMKNRESGRR